MRKLHKYTVFYRNLYGSMEELHYKAFNDIDAAARGVSLCERNRAEAAVAAGFALVERLGAFIALEIVADEKDGTVIWTNAILDVLS